MSHYSILMGHVFSIKCSLKNPKGLNMTILEILQSDIRPVFQLPNLPDVIKSHIQNQIDNHAGQIKLAEVFLKSEKEEVKAIGEQIVETNQRQINRLQAMPIGVFLTRINGQLGRLRNQRVPGVANPMLDEDIEKFEAMQSWLLIETMSFKT